MFQAGRWPSFVSDFYTLNVNEEYCLICAETRDNAVS